MKLWAMVLAFHQKPTAISGIDGNPIKANPCASASATNSASQDECCRMPVDRAPTAAATQTFSDLSESFRRCAAGHLWEAVK